MSSFTKRHCGKIGGRRSMYHPCLQYFIFFSCVYRSGRSQIEERTDWGKEYVGVPALVMVCNVCKGKQWKRVQPIWLYNPTLYKSRCTSPPHPNLWSTFYGTLLFYKCISAPPALHATATCLKHLISWHEPLQLHPRTRFVSTKFWLSARCQSCIRLHRGRWSEASVLLFILVSWGPRDIFTQAWCASVNNI